MKLAQLKNIWQIRIMQVSYLELKIVKISVSVISKMVKYKRVDQGFSILRSNYVPWVLEKSRPYHTMMPFGVS